VQQRSGAALVAANRQVAERTWEVVVESDRGEPIDFLAGQFAWLNLGHSTFSLTEIPVGTRAWLDGPHEGLGFGVPGGQIIAERFKYD